MWTIMLNKTIVRLTLISMQSHEVALTWMRPCVIGLCVCVCGGGGGGGLRPSQPDGLMSSAVSLPNHTFTGQA